MVRELTEVRAAISDAEAALSRLGRGLQFCVLPGGRLALVHGKRIALLEGGNPALWTTGFEVAFGDLAS